MPDAKIYRVMISSTTRDLPDHRRAALDAILRADMKPEAMEFGTATSNSDALRFSLNMVDRADIYVGIFGFRYGYRPVDPVRNPQNLSITELEYRRAKERGIPVLLFVMDEMHPRVVGDISQGDDYAQMTRLRDELGKEIVAFFKSPDDMSLKMYQALIQHNMSGNVQNAPATVGRVAPSSVPPTTQSKSNASAPPPVAAQSNTATGGRGCWSMFGNVRGALVVGAGLLFAFLALFPEQTRTEWFQNLGLVPKPTATFTLVPPPTLTNTSEPSDTPVSTKPDTVTVEPSATPSHTATHTALPSATDTLTPTLIPPSATDTQQPTNTPIPPTPIQPTLTKHPTATAVIMPSSTSIGSCQARIIPSSTPLRIVRAAPGSNAVAAAIQGDSIVEVVDRRIVSGTLWYQIRYETHTGWLSLDGFANLPCP